VGALVTDGTDADVLASLRKALDAEGALLELIAPTVGGITTTGGEQIPAHQNVAGGPSVLYDAVAVLPSAEGAALLAQDPAAKDFVTDAHAHCKFVAHTPEAMALFEAAGVADLIDDGYVALGGNGATAFVEACRAVRLWAREALPDRPS
jgi:catalase